MTRDWTAGVRPEALEAWNQKCDDEERDARNPVELQQENSVQITITLTVTPRHEPGDPVSEETLTEALDALAWVMSVQAEDGLYSGGYADSAEAEAAPLADLAITGVAVQIVDTP